MTQDLHERIRREREQIEQRRAKLVAQLEELNLEQQRLDNEAQELEIAERVVNRWYQPLEPNPQDPPQPEPDRPGKKPEGLPSVPQMIEMVLLAAEKEGHSELEPVQVTERIRGNWWPAVQATDIGPTLWRLAKFGKLARNGSKYGRIKTEKAPSHANGAGNELGKS